MHLGDKTALDTGELSDTTNPSNKLPSKDRKVDTDQVSILTVDSDVPAWYRDGCDDKPEGRVDDDISDTISIIRVQRSQDPNDTRVGKMKVADEPSGSKIDENEADDNYGWVEDYDDDDDEYVPDSPVSTSSTLLDAAEQDRPGHIANPVEQVGYSNAKKQAPKPKNKHDVYRQRLQQWLNVNGAQNQAGPSNGHLAGMCTMCGLRPQCTRGGIKYPTCGLTCASKLAQGIPTADMCTYCHHRPKAVVNGRVYPQCGNDCRKRAEQYGILDPLWENVQPIASGSTRPSNMPKGNPLAGPSSNRRNGLDAFLSPPKKKVCVVCQRNPPYNDGLRSFPTCGRRCGVILSSRLPAGGQSRPRSHSQPPRPDYNFYYQATPPTVKPKFNVKMCSVCRIRPQYRRDGTVYPTCGLTCSAKLSGPEALLCSHCHQRPKAVRRRDGKVYPQCGKTCRDKAWLASWTPANPMPHLRGHRKQGG